MRDRIDDPDPNGKKTHGEGIYSTWSKRKGCRVYYCERRQRARKGGQG